MRDKTLEGKIKKEVYAEEEEKKDREKQMEPGESEETERISTEERKTSAKIKERTKERKILNCRLLFSRRLLYVISSFLFSQDVLL